MPSNAEHWEHWPTARRLLEQAGELTPDERDVFLARETIDNPPLRALIDRLLAAEGAEDDFLEPPTLDRDAVSGVHAQPEPAGTRVGAYELRRLIARGGMGAVYEAEQSDPRRRVALKMLPPGAVGRAATERFRDEIDLLARLAHPGIAAIYEAGVFVRGGEEATPWFTMELVEDARPLTDFAREERLDLEQRLRLMLELCDAVMHGHQRGVLHRDLKPANILVDRSGRLKVIDFGVALATDGDPLGADERTLEGEIIGTLLYMSPEQIEGRREEVDTRADVYALGVVLYQLLCDERPHAIEGLPITRAGRVLCEDDPAPPSTRATGIPADLDWVCARAMAKQRERRYGTVAELAAEIERFLAHEPVVAGPPSRAYHLRKFARRHRVGVTAAALVLVTMIGALIGISAGILRARDAESLAQRDRQIAVDAERQAQRDRGIAVEEARTSTAVVDYLVDFLGSPDPGREGREVRVVDSLERAQASYVAQFAESPGVRLRIAEALGRVYQGLGLGTESEVELRRALETARERSRDSGAESVANADEARLQRLLGSVLMLQGRLDESDEALQAAYDMEIALGVEDPVGLHRLQVAWGRLRLTQRRRAEAIELLSAGVTGLKATLGPEHRDTLVAQNPLAGALHESGDFERAEPIYRDALQGLEELLGAEHPDTLRLRFNHAMLLHSLGRADEAISIFQEQLEIRRRVFGPDHPETLSVIPNLAGMLQVAGRLDEAAALYDEGLATMEAVLPPSHRALQAMRINLGVLEKMRGEHEHAEELLSTVYEQRRADHGPGAEATLQVLFRATQNSREQGALALAEQRARTGFESAREALGTDHTFSYEYERELGRTLTALGRYEEALEVLQSSRETYSLVSERVSGLSSPDAELAALFHAWGQPERAAEFEGGETSP